MTAAAATHDHPYLPGMGRDWLLPLYDPLTRLLGLAATHRRLIDQAALEPGARVLEIGCGTGNLLLLAKQLHPGIAAAGIDPDPRALARARRKAARRSLEVEFCQGFAERLPYPDAGVDRVLSAFMFHHLEPEGRRRALSEIRRVLRPGGSLHLLDFGGAVEPGDGLMSRVAQRSERLQDNGRIPELMVEAGLQDAAEVAHEVTRLGRRTYYRAVTP